MVTSSLDPLSGLGPVPDSGESLELFARAQPDAGVGPTAPPGTGRVPVNYPLGCLAEADEASSTPTGAAALAAAAMFAEVQSHP